MLQTFGHIAKHSYSMWPRFSQILSKVASSPISFKMFFLVLCNFLWDQNHETSILVAISNNALCERHFKKHKNNKWKQDQSYTISTTMYSQLALGLQVHKNKSGKYPNSCKLLHLHTPIHTISCKQCTFFMLYTRNLYLYSAKYWFHVWGCWKGI